MRKLRTLDEVTEGYFRDHPEEIDDYLTEIFQDFAEDNDTGVLLASLRIIARVDFHSGSEPLDRYLRERADRDFNSN
jgi:DNA-binding phage protein